MMLGSTSKMLAATALALLIGGGLPGVAHAWAPQDSGSQKEQKQALYPNATREEPELDLTKQEDADALNKGLDAVNAGDAATARQILKPFADGTASDSKYVQALALQGLANLKYNEQDLKGAIDLLKRSLAVGVMPNDTYYQLMYQLAQFYAADDQYQLALDTLHNWRAEGKRETADSYGLEGVIDYRLEKYPEAIAAINKAKSMTDKPKESWNQVLAASYAETGQGDQAIAMAKKQLATNPDDATTRHNVVVLLMQAQKYPEALKMMEEARAKGQLSTDTSYINLAKLHMMVGQNSGEDPKPEADKAQQVLAEGLEKGVIKPSYDVYKLQGDAALIASETDKALAAYKKAAAMGGDGYAELRSAQLMNQDHQYSAARKAAREAISKGTKHKGKAYMVIAEAERGMDNKAAAVKAMRQAAQDPETRDRAQAWLKKAGH